MVVKEYDTDILTLKHVKLAWLVELIHLGCIEMHLFFLLLKPVIVVCIKTFNG